MTYQAFGFSTSGRMRAFKKKQGNFASPELKWLCDDGE